MPRDNTRKPKPRSRLRETEDDGGRGATRRRAGRPRRAGAAPAPEPRRGARRKPEGSTGPRRRGAARPASKPSDSSSGVIELQPFAGEYRESRVIDVEPVNRTIESDQILFGKIAVEGGLISSRELRRVIQLQKDRQEDDPTFLGDILIEEKLILAEDVDAVLRTQHRNLQKQLKYTGHKREEALLGKLVAVNKLASADEVNECLRWQAELEQFDEQVPLGELLIARGYIRSKHLEKLLEVQKKREWPCPSCGEKTTMSLFEFGRTIDCSECGEEIDLPETPESSQLKLKIRTSKNKRLKPSQDAAKEPTEKRKRRPRPPAPSEDSSMIDEPALNDSGPQVLSLGASTGQSADLDDDELDDDILQEELDSGEFDAVKLEAPPDLNDDVSDSELSDIGHDDSDDGGPEDEQDSDIDGPDDDSDFDDDAEDSDLDETPPDESELSDVDEDDLFDDGPSGLEDESSLSHDAADLDAGPDPLDDPLLESAEEAAVLVDSGDAVPAHEAHEESHTESRIVVVAKGWFLGMLGRAYGPIPSRLMETLISRGVIGAEDLFWNESLDGWTPLGKVEQWSSQLTRRPVVGSPPIPDQVVSPKAMADTLDELVRSQKLDKPDHRKLRKMLDRPFTRDDPA